MKTKDYKSIERAGGPLAAAFLRLGAWQLEIPGPIALLDGRLEQAAHGMQEHGIEGEGDALAVRGVQRHHRLAVAVVAGLDARQEHRFFAERRRMAGGVVRLGKGGL